MHCRSYICVINYTSTTEIYTLSLHDALPILAACPAGPRPSGPVRPARPALRPGCPQPDLHRRWPRASWSDRKSTRLNSSHVRISYAVFCLKKKNFNTLTLFNHLFNETPGVTD